MLRTLLTKRRDTGIRFPLFKTIIFALHRKKTFASYSRYMIDDTEINVHRLFQFPLRFHKINDSI